jgi:hypothetical protein
MFNSEIGLLKRGKLLSGAQGPRDIGKCTRLPAFVLRFGSQEECAS